MKNAVIYARYSSDKQTEQSIEGQIRVCKEFAERENYRIVDTYIDRAISGKTDNRPGLQKMLKDSFTKTFEIVIVYKLDRFARDRYASAVNKALLKKNGVKLVSAMENITDSPEGIILESLIEGMAEYYSVELAQKVKRGRIESLNKGNSIGGVLTYGYKIVDKKHQIDEEKAEVVKDIFNKYLSGWLIKDIVDYLKNKGLKFSKSSVTRLLENRRYTGVFNFNGVEYKNYMPKIIEESDFENVQTKLAMKRKAPGSFKAKTNYLLSGKLYCGYCNSLIYGESCTNHSGNKYYYYKCSTNKKEPGECKSPVLKKEELENKIVEITQQHIFDSAIFDTIVKNMVKVSNSYNQNNIINILQEQKADKLKETNSIVSMIKKGNTSTILGKELEKLENEIAEIDYKIEQEEYKKMPTLDENFVKFWLEQFRDIDLNDEKAKETFFDAFIKKVVVYENKIQIVYNISENNKKDISIEELKCLINKSSNMNYLVGNKGLGPLTSTTSKWHSTNWVNCPYSLG